MKTNRIVALLAVLCLITTCFVGTTLAKYTTSANAGDNARVAKFGVKVVTTGDEAFNTTYAAKEGAEYATAIANTVVSSDTDKLVAPGTKGALAATTITGTPEVAVNVKKVAVLDLGDNWVDENGDEYCPIVFKVNGTEIKFVDSVANLETAVMTAASVDINYAANTPLDGTDDVAITWEWAFEGNSDENDTFLGDEAAAGRAATIDFTLTTTVTQLD